MCTILTFDKAFYLKNEAKIKKQIVTDSVDNGDGFALLMMGASYEDVNLIRSMSVDLILAAIEAQFKNNAAERAWLHCRYATSGFIGLNGCHGFGAGDYSIFHNGILSRQAADSFFVDSELIAFDVEAYGLETAIKNLMEHDNYANVFIVNNTTGAFSVIRRISGTLYTDGLGNYSSNKFGMIKHPVPINTRIDYNNPVIEKLRPKYKYSYANYNYDLSKSVEATMAETGQVWDYLDQEYVDLPSEIQDQIESLRYANTAEDFAEMAEYENWVRHGVPDAVWTNFNDRQLEWCTQMGITLERQERSA